MVSREEEPPHTSHHGAREISIGKNKEYKKEKIFYMDVLKTIHKKISNQRERERDTERETHRARETERQRERKRDRQRERERIGGKTRIESLSPNNKERKSSPKGQKKSLSLK